MISLPLLLFLSRCLFTYSSSVLPVFPSTYSQYFDNSSPRVNISLSEAFLLGEENQGIFGLSLWIKIIDSTASGEIFKFETEKSLNEPRYWYPNLQYSPHGYFILQLIDKEDTDITIIFTPSTNWIFLAFSVSYEMKSSIFYYNSLGTEIYKSGKYTSNFPMKFDSLLWIGGPGNMCARIGDVKFYNNICNDAADWNLVALNSCIGISCASLYPSICYAECDQWCKSESEWFLPLIRPVLNPYMPYISIQRRSYDIKYEDVYFDVNIPANGWNDYSVTGWVQFPVCHSELTTFFELANAFAVPVLNISLTSSSLSNPCDTLMAAVYNLNSVNYAYSSVSLSSSSFIGNWFFFGATVNSGSKLLTLYTQNSANPPSASFPLISSSFAYPYVAAPLTVSIKFYIGENAYFIIYPGNYADFRVYPGNHIDTTLLQYSNNIYSAATYIEPHCSLWESIWYCKACENGYFIKNGLCQKCHPSCETCSSDNTETVCLSCANGYYAQPGHPTMCLDYCPLGYIWDSSLRKCTGTKDTIANINFDDNLSGNFISSNIYVGFGKEKNYYPDFDFFDPLPANKRGIYLDNDELTITPKDSIQAGRLVGTDFTIEIWAMVHSYGDLYKASVGRAFIINDPVLNYENFYQIIVAEFKIDQYERLSFLVQVIDSEYKHLNIDTAWPTIINSFSNPEWCLYSLSLSYDDLSKTTQILLSTNTDHYIETVAAYYKELYGMNHYIGDLPSAARGFFYSFAMYNYAKTYSEIQLTLGICSSCSACPGVLNYCLPTCDKTEYVDDNGNCQKCLSSCTGICSRAGTCNLCYDDLCYKCTKYESGTCSQCVENAILKSGQCECQSGYIKQSSKCVDKCEDGYYLDLNTQSCLSCLSNCLKCSEENICTICENDFVLKNGICECADSYFTDSSNKCSKCDSLCLTCSIISSNCTSCTQSAPILYDTNNCYPCKSFEGYSSSFIVSAKDFSDTLLSQLSSNCIEICGDGRNMGQAQCDDGNNNNGDGCSSNCTVETGWSCSGGSTNSLDICKDLMPPSPILAYLSENGSGYLLVLSFSEAVYFDIEIPKNIKIEISGITKFIWSISLKNSIYIITLEIYENVASGTSVIVNFIDPSSVVDLNGNVMQESYAQTKLATSFTYQLGQLMETSVTTVTTSATVGAVVGSISSGMTLGMFNLQALWGMVEMMQIQYYLIFLSPKYPDNLLSYISALSIANGNFLPNPFQKYLIKRDPFPDPPERFIEENFNTDFIMNAGQFLLVWFLILIGLPIVLLFLKLFPKVSIFRWLKRSYLFSILLRIGIESFLEITLSVFLQWREISEPNQNIGYLSLILSFITMAYLILTFLLIIWQVTLKSEEELTTEVHEVRFGTLYEGFKTSSKLTASFLLLQNARRVLFAIFCVFLYEYTIIQVTLSAVLSFIYTISLVLLRPFKSKILGNGLHISSEFCYFSAHCMILKFLDDQLSDNDRVRLGWIVIALLCFSVMLHIFALFITQIISIIQGIKHLKNNFMKNFANKFVHIGKSNLKSIILDNKVSPKNQENESESFTKRKRKHIEIKDEIHSFRKTKIVPIDESLYTDTMGDEFFTRKE
ncbi:unnamed protein product [Blepharisma stoltei]|uniref:EGF-like domain-containing protein n=1 Tax=Blepharisma stoltei TaxID=1481888 RepID=A0AAU9JVG3_9CILI|nr:unnamed protein product [Blepharisma stoltei]